jgi:molybdopterin-guanine dinucleotide biosynthesis protein A
MAVRAEQITGLVHAGGRGERLGGADKGWVLYRGRPMIEWVVERFRPQVGQLRSSASASLQNQFAAGGRAMRGWLESLLAVAFELDDAAAFRNINSAEDAEGRAA